MTKTPRSQSSGPSFPSGTAASSYHLPESLDWSSLSAQMKNRTILIPAYLKTIPAIKMPENRTVAMPRPDKQPDKL